MIHADHRFHEAVEAAVRRIEARTDAELVVVSAGRSGSYRDASLVGAALCTLALLVVVLFVPYVVPPWAVVLEIGVFFPFVAWLLDGPMGLRLLASADRRTRHVRTAAEAEFFHEGAHATPQRTGVLVYVSALEGLVVVLPDVGIEGLVPLGEWRAVTDRFAADHLDGFLASLDALGEVLARHVPPRDDPNRLELSDAPRVRP